MAILRNRVNHVRKGIDQTTMSKGGQISQRKSAIGSCAGSNMVVWLKGIALDPCNSKASIRSASKLWNRNLQLWKFIRLNNDDCPRRKRKLKQYSNSGKLVVDYGPVSKKLNSSSDKILGSRNFPSLPDSGECPDAQTVLNSCSSDSILKFEGDCQAKNSDLDFSSLENAAKLDSSNNDVSPLNDTDELVNSSNTRILEIIIIDDEPATGSDGLDQISESSDLKEKLCQSVELSSDKSWSSGEAVLVEPSLEAEIPALKRLIYQENPNDDVDHEESLTLSETKVSCVETTAEATGKKKSASSSKSPQVVVSNLSNSRKRVKKPVRFMKAKCQRRLVIPIGPGFQAEIPDWKGLKNQDNVSRDEDSESLKWLGTRVWPIKGISTETICEGIDLGSAKRLKRHFLDAVVHLGHNLGPAFSSWKFDEMGEDVSKPWASKEEGRFDSPTKSNPLSNELSFLELALDHFPSKSMRDAFQYHCNVFLPRRMSQLTKRSTCEVDSDPDQI